MLSLIAASLFTVAFLSGSARGAEVVGQQLDASSAIIRFRGEIEEGDLGRLQHVMNSLNNPPRSIVLLDSPGGSVPEAMRIGRYFREIGSSVSVIPPENGGQGCYSSCVLALAGGVTRVLGWDTTVGIHRPRFDYSLFANLTAQEAREKYNAMSEDVREYLKEMGISDDLYLAMLAVPSDRIRILSYDEAAAWHLDGEDSAYAEWRRARIVDRLGEEQADLLKEYTDKLTNFLAQCHNSGQTSEACAEAAGRRFKQPGFSPPIRNP